MLRAYARLDGEDRKKNGKPQPRFLQYCRLDLALKGIYSRCREGVGPGLRLPKSDSIDSLRMLELFRLRHSLRTARDVLQLVIAAPPENEKLKQLTRRQRQLVNDKVRLIARMVAALQALCPGLLALTGAVDNVWFLSLLAARADLRKLPGLRGTTWLGLPGIGKKYAALIKTWQRDALLADDDA
jgi:hypothetical protein